MIGILGAMDSEIAAFRDGLAGTRRTEWNGFVFDEGKLAGQTVVVVKSGVGKAFAAMITQRLIDAYAPRALLYTGIAGALNPVYEIGDIILARDLVQHDLDARRFGFERGRVPYTDYRFLVSDPGLLEAARSYAPEKTHVRVGRVLTGDQFIERTADRDWRYLTEELAGDAVEMEGASFALVATVNAVPFLVIRTVSDRADGRSMADYRAFLPRASANSFGIAVHILKQLQGVEP